MDSTQVYSSKAEKYARYRWAYATEAIQTIFEVTGITAEFVVVDIGAGTGILTREFIGKVKQVFAVEPNPRNEGNCCQGIRVNIHLVKLSMGTPRLTSLDDHSIDLITAAQAVHWFEPQATRKEFFRIIRLTGWLAICRNYGTDHELGEALKNIFPAETNTSSIMVGKRPPTSFFFGENPYLKQEFPFAQQVPWEEFLGGLSTASYAPDAGSSFIRISNTRPKKYLSVLVLMDC